LLQLQAVVAFFCLVVYRDMSGSEVSSAAVFFFLLPAQMLLFVDPDKIIRFIEQKREFYKQKSPLRVVYDGKCKFCNISVLYLKVMDLFGRLEYVDLHSVGDFQAIHPDLDKNKALARLYLVEPKGDGEEKAPLYGGFYAFRRLSWFLPMMMPFLPVLYFPGMGLLGSLGYKFIARHRYLIPAPGHFKCSENGCKS